ncbi:MAG TPA: hypothetical protein VG963_24575 [Polyangiaceae bacterium]|nr:hypothetical protein [Polyangiaceae bacterium]
MRYVVLQYARGAAGLATWTAQAAPFAELSRELRETGELVWMEALAGTALLPRRSVAATRSAPAPDPLLASWVIECDTEQRALEIAGRIAQGQAPNGAATDFSVQVRPVLRSSGEEM